MKTLAIKVLGFTLIEVLLALAIIAIALTALIKNTAQNVYITHRLKEKTISHWVAMEGVKMIQLKLFEPNPSYESTQATTLLGQKWYWRARIKATHIKNMQEIIILMSLHPEGPFQEELRAFRYIL